MTYTAGLRHHSISRARTVSAETIDAAKRLASREFRDEFQDYEIVIVNEADEIVSRRRVSERRWHDAD
jgi:hypothetical protein